MQQVSFDPDDDVNICDECGDREVDVFEQQCGLFLCAECIQEQERRAADSDGGEEE